MTLLSGKSAIFITAALGCLSLAQAATYVDNWSFGGTGWSSTYAPTDTSAQGATIGVTDYSGALDVDFGLYTFFSAPVFTLTTNDYDSETATVSLTVVSTTAAQGVTLDFNDLNSALTNYTLVETDLGEVSGGGFSANLYEYVYTWDVSELGESDGLSITWSLENHVVISGASLTQSDVIPEPTTAALGAIAFAGWFVRRKRQG
jgi:hypothetical protein